MSKLPLERTDAPGIYRRGSRYVVVHRVEGRQRKQYAGTLAEARAIKLDRDGEARGAASRPDAARVQPLTASAGAPRHRQRRDRCAQVSPRRAADPADAELAATLRAHRPRNGIDDACVFPGRDGGASDQGSLRRRVLVPAAERARLTGVAFHTLRRTCASMLIESGLSPLRLQRWMRHHSPAFTLETYGHLIDGDLGPGLDLRKELRRA